jgi:hypothetical protein
MWVEYIPERKKEVIVPIIQKHCLPGTVIITKDWAGYGHLEDLGYCHYILSKTQGFLDPNNANLHHCNVKNAFNWLKYQIKSRNRSAVYLQEHILEWLWKKRTATRISSEDSTYALFKSALEILARLNKLP